MDFVIEVSDVVAAPDIVLFDQQVALAVGIHIAFEIDSQ